eukprot:Sro58_g033810.2  (305) ;mRNA; r:84408-85322
MIGESILSLLIVETTETAEYYGITAMGCLTVIIIQMIIFESEPSHSNGHALSRSMFTATLYGMLIQLLSASLIAFGVSYKIMLTNVLMQVEEEEQEHEEGHRMLAGGTIDIPDKTVASLYCYSLAVILLTLELMLTTQKSVTKSYAVLCRDLALCRFWSVNWPLLIICLFKVVLIAYTLSLSQWSWASQTLKVNIMGFLIVTNMATTRVVGWGVVQHDNDIKEKMVSIKSRAVSIILSTRSLPKRKSRAKTPASGRSLSSRSHSSSTTDDRISMDEALFEAPIERLEPPSDRAGEIKQLNKYVI